MEGCWAAYPTGHKAVGVSYKDKNRMGRETKTGK